MADTQQRDAPGVLDRALALVEFLRAHCPWDAAQTPASLRRHLLEEAHEAAAAIAEGDDDALADELGDLLLNLAFQIVLAEERRAFDRHTVVDRLEAKMRRRHPHLYGGAAEPWEAIKARERGPASSVLDRVPRGLDPLSRALRLQRAAAEIGFDWPDAAGPLAKVEEEVAEVRTALASDDKSRAAEELGDLLFSVVNLARHLGVHPVEALLDANAKFERRFRGLERRAAARPAPPLAELDRLWDDEKARERAP